MSTQDYKINTTLGDLISAISEAATECITLDSELALTIRTVLLRLAMDNPHRIANSIEDYYSAIG